MFMSGAEKACGLNQCIVGAFSIFKTLKCKLIFFEGLVDVEAMNE